MEHCKRFNESKPVEKLANNSACLATPVSHVALVLHVLVAPGKSLKGMLLYGLYLPLLRRIAKFFDCQLEIQSQC